MENAETAHNWKLEISFPKIVDPQPPDECSKLPRVCSKLTLKVEKRLYNRQSHLYGVRYQLGQGRDWEAHPGYQNILF